MVDMLKEKLKIPIAQWFICFENTGVYSKAFLEWLFSQQIVCKEEMALKIKKSAGLKRGKTDKMDSKGIAQYAFEKRDSIEPSKLPKRLITNLKHFLSRRDFLVRKKQSFEISLKEKAHILDPDLRDILLSQNKEFLDIFKRQIKELEVKIDELIKQDIAVKNNSIFLQSVVGIGPVISAYLIALTDNFSLFENSRKFASYTGIAPFPNSSGIKVGKSRVSSIANKKMKSLLSNGARTAILYDKELKKYYNRKLKEGKSKGCALNAVKNKLIHRAFAVVRRQSPYVRLMTYA